jgi:hypothetical protein
MISVTTSPADPRPGEYQHRGTGALRNHCCHADRTSNRINAYVAAIGSPRVARAKITTATGLLETEFARADMILQERIDGLIEQFKDSGTTFYSDYKNARRIVDTGSQPTPPAPSAPGPLGHGGQPPGQPPPGGLCLFRCLWPKTGRLIALT